MAKIEDTAIEQHLRTMSGRYIKPLFIKDKCEICNTDEKLCFHHVYPFAKMLEDTINALGYKYRMYLRDYTSLEIGNITKMMLGTEIISEYLTVCADCHHSIHASQGGYSNTTSKHKDYYTRHNEMKKQNETQRIEYVVKPYLRSIQGQRLQGEEKEKLIQVCGAKKDRKTVRSYRMINQFLKEFGVNYVISPQRTMHGRYWVVEAIDDMR